MKFMQPVESPRPEIAICAYPVFEFPLGTCRQCGVSFAAGMRANVGGTKERQSAPNFVPTHQPQMVLQFPIWNEIEARNRTISFRRR